MRRRRLTEEERDAGAAARPGLSIDLESFMEERREVKQMKSSLEALLREWGLSLSNSISWIDCFYCSDFIAVGESTVVFV